MLFQVARTLAMAHLLTSPQTNPRARARKSLGPGLKSSKSRRQGICLDDFFFCRAPNFVRKPFPEPKTTKFVNFPFFRKLLAGKSLKLLKRMFFCKVLLFRKRKKDGITAAKYNVGPGPAGRHTTQTKPRVFVSMRWPPGGIL